MEATSKTTATRAALLVVAALSMLLSGLFVATASQSDATPPPACPDGFSLTADEKNCYQNAVITSADNPNTCEKGLLTPDGERCYVAARVIPQEGSTECPDGYTPDDSLGGMCARFENASQHDPGCPDGAHGVAGGCYMLVAVGPAGDPTCEEGTLAANGKCEVIGDPPEALPGNCPSGALEDDDGECYKLVSPIYDSWECPEDGTYSDVGGTCKFIMPGSLTPAADDYDCPSGGTLVELDAGGHMKAAYCELTGSATPRCPDGTTDENGNASECRRPVDIEAGALACEDGFGLLQNPTRCVLYRNPTPSLPSCPIGATKVDNECHKPVADADGAYYCTDAAAALNGKYCVYTAPFTANFQPDAYKCDEGTRAVVGDQVLCFLGASQDNVTEGPSCLQGVLSTDNLYCIVPRIDQAPATVATAPRPAFTG